MLSEARQQSEADYDSFEALCDAAFDGEDDGLMFFWKAYMDASGKRSDDFLVVAGYLSNRHQWKVFNQAWRVPLTRNGHTDVFHATDFEAGQGDFTEEKGWSSDRIKEARVQLVDALLGAGLHKGFACGVHISDYEQTIPRWMKEQNGLSTPYEFAVHACMGVAAKWAQDNGIPDPIQYVVEHGDAKEGKFQEAFRNAFAIPGARQFHRLGRLIFDTKEGALGLQAADMLAHYLWAWQMGNISLVEPYNRVVNDPKVRWQIFDREQLLREIEIDRAGRTTVTAEGTLYRKTPDPIDIQVTPDFTEAEALITELELLAESNPEGVHALIKHSPSFEKLFRVNAENRSTPPANELRISFKPNDLALAGIAALRTDEADSNLSEGEVSH